MATLTGGRRARMRRAINEQSETERETERYRESGGRRL